MSPLSSNLLMMNFQYLKVKSAGLFRLVSKSRNNKNHVQTYTSVKKTQDLCHESCFVEGIVVVCRAV